MSVEHAELDTLLKKSQLPLSIQIYALAVICLMAGIALGYLCRGTDSDVAPMSFADQNSAVDFR